MNLNFLKIAMISLLTIQLVKSDVAYPKGHEEAYNYENKHLKDNGYYKEKSFDITRGIEQKSNEEPEILFMMVYSNRGDPSTEAGVKQMPTKFAFEIYPSDKVFKMAENKIEDKDDLSSKPSKEAINIEFSNSMLNIFELKTDLFKVTVNTSENDCLALFPFVSDGNDQPELSIDSENKIVYLDFKNGKNYFYRGQYYDRYPMLVNTLQYEIHQAFETTRYKKLNMFCPFYKDDTNVNVKGDLSLEYLSDLPFYRKCVFKRDK